MTTPGQFCFARAPVYPPIQFPALRVCDPVMILHCDTTNGMNRISFNSYNEFYTRLLDYKGVLLISEICAVIASNFK